MESWYFLTHLREIDNKTKQNISQTQKIPIKALDIMFNAITWLIPYYWWIWKYGYTLLFWKCTRQFQKYIRDESIF